MPLLADREVAYVRDEQALYIGTAEGNLRLCAAGDTRRLSALPIPALSPLAADATAAEIIAAHNALLAALEAAGIAAETHEEENNE